jgi:hypothetical protein
MRAVGFHADEDLVGRAAAYWSERLDGDGERRYARQRFSQLLPIHRQIEAREPVLEERSVVREALLDGRRSRCHGVGSVENLAAGALNLLGSQ